MEFSFSSYSDIMGVSYSFSSEIIRPIPPQYQVFINFRGELRRFVKVLVDDLKEELVNVFVDEDAVRGEDLETLFAEIEKSRIAVTIFSERYTESKWCLNELVKINECMDKGKLDVFPVFFNVKAEDVKKLEGNFGENFRTTSSRDKKRTNKWKKALTSVSGKFGLSSQIRFSLSCPFPLF
ncbi:vesicle-associated protein 1-4 [Raphanus sativus]|uniref:Vesicle-associated protein 1-4 n=1 Tax=Raphanus sativus TaxID=3726 RepID=A0A9W3CID9_RAPSA|nr:vesicle-associated protein 1-4 [Raphanus sativus]